MTRNLHSRRIQHYHLVRNRLAVNLYPPATTHVILPATMQVQNTTVLVHPQYQTNTPNVRDHDFPQIFPTLQTEIIPPETLSQDEFRYPIEIDHAHHHHIVAHHPWIINDQDQLYRKKDIDARIGILVVGVIGIPPLLLQIIHLITDDLTPRLHHRQPLGEGYHHHHHRHDILHAKI